MAESRKDRIIKTANEILGTEPNGVRTGELTERIRKAMNDDKHRVQHAALLEDVKKAESAMYQPDRGWFRSKQFKDIAWENRGQPTRPARLRRRRKAEL